MTVVSAFRRVSVRYFAEHKLRTVFTIFGVALGVAAMIGIRLLHENAQRSYERSVDRIAGKAALQITNGDVGVPEELLDEVRAVPGVAAAAASVQGFVPLADRPGERLYIFGIDLLADQALRDYDEGSDGGAVDDPLAFLAQPDSVALTERFLGETGLRLDDKVTLVAPRGAVVATIRATLAVDRGPATLFAGRFALMDIFAAQQLFDMKPRFTQIDVTVAGDARVEDVAAILTSIAGGRGVVERPRNRGEALDRLLGSIRYSLTTVAFFTVLVGLYLVFNTMMIAVAERRRDLGILRGLGMSRADVLRLVAAESLALGIVGCVLGMPLGIALARAMYSTFLSNVSTLYMPLGVSEIEPRLEAIVLGVVLGLLSALIAAAIPARDAIRLHPLETLRPSSAEVRREERFRGALILGALLTASATALWMGRGMLPTSEMLAGRIASLGWLVGLSLVVPSVVRAFANRAEPVLGWALGSVGMLASRSLARHVGRVAITSSAFVLSLSVAIAIASIVSSVQLTFVRWFDLAFSGMDIVITSGETPLSRNSPPLPGTVADEIAKLPGIAYVDRVRMAKIPYSGSLITLGSSNMELVRNGVRQFELLQGDAGSAFAVGDKGPAAAVNEAFSRKFNRGIGDDLILPAPAGELRLPVVGVYFEVDDIGTVWIDQRLYRHWWRDDTANFVVLMLEAGTDRERMMDTIRQRFHDRNDLVVLTAEEFNREGRELIGQTAALSYPLIIMAVVIALLGIVNSLLASVLDRIREIGLLRVAGATPGQIAASVVVECGAIGVLAGTLAVVLGSLLGYLQVDILGRGLFALTVFYHHPTTETVFALVASIALAILAGLIPGRAAARLRVRKTLQYE